MVTFSFAKPGVWGLLRVGFRGVGVYLLVVHVSSSCQGIAVRIAGCFLGLDAAMALHASHIFVTV